MSDVAVFDRFYRRPEFAPSDVAAHALDPENHRVVVWANALGEAVLSLAAMSEGHTEIPDVLIVGGMLEGERDYLKQPPTITREIEVSGRTALGRRIVRQRQVATTLIPLRNANGGMALPTSYRSPFTPKKTAELIEEFRFGSIGGRAAYVLSHLTRILLPESSIKIVGLSAYDSMSDLPVDAVIKRGAPGDAALLRAAINDV